ncbi:MAG: tRNA preQ1(34) S-adenosylmethionine ribosyltransferase-isomerase QueA [Pseudomonadota bacterium]
MIGSVGRLTEPISSGGNGLLDFAAMRPDTFDYELPDELIARYPMQARSASKLLCLRAGGQIDDRTFSDLPSELKSGDLMVFNDTKVLRARLFGRKSSGGKVELLLERVTGAYTASAQIRASHAPKVGGLITITDDSGQRVSDAEVIGREDRFFSLRFERAVEEIMDRAGHVPLPPYIDRADEVDDQSRYQTVYAKHPGAVAAPTAGLHFDAALLRSLDAAQIGRHALTLHVAAGTFQPLTDKQLESNTLHEERMVISQDLVDAVRRTQQAGGRVVAVGTTSLRALESAVVDGTLVAGERDTDIFIRPGFEFQVVDGLVTNFHLPASSLMMLVGAFAGVDPIMRAYRHAVDERYRFFSYGDAMLMWRNEGVT